MRIDGCIHNTCRAEEYARHIFLSNDLPGSMSVKSCLHMSFKLKLPELHREIAKKLLKQTKLVPHATTHSGTTCITFSTSAITLLMSGSLSDSYISEEDAHRLVVAGTSLLADHFPLAVKGKKKAETSTMYQEGGENCVEVVWVKKLSAHGWHNMHRGHCSS